MSSIATVDTSAMGCSINNAAGNACIEGVEDVATGSAQYWLNCSLWMPLLVSTFEIQVSERSCRPLLPLS